MSFKTLFARDDFGFACPDGGEWYSCGNGTRFVGCCTKDPCNDVGCGDGTLKKATFDTSRYGEFADAECSSGEFYTCTGTTPAFWGCCKTKACNGTGCPQDQLAAAYLGSNAAEVSAYSPTGGPSTTSTSTPSASTSASSSDDNHGTGTIIGAAVGGAIAGALILGTLIFFCLRHRRSKMRAKQAEDEPPSEDIAAVKPELSASDSVRVKKGAVFPPRYSSIVNASEAFELEDTGVRTSELQGDDASHIRPELEGSDVGDTMSELDGSSAPSSPRGLRRSAMVAAARVKKLTPDGRHHGGDDKSELTVSAHGSPKSSPSPRSVSFPRDSDSAVSSEASSPMTPRFAPHASSPKHPPIIEEETREDDR